MSKDRLSIMSATTIGTKGEGRREPFSCSLNEADQLAKFSSIGGYRNVINNSNRVLLTKLYTKVLEKQRIITA